MTRNLDGKVAIVTGAGQGVGRGIALVLAREGAKVVVNDLEPGMDSTSKYKKEDMSPEEYDKMLLIKGKKATVELIQSEGGVATPFYCDVTDHNATKEMIDFAVEKYGRLDILVNNAAGLGQGTIETTTEKEWDYQTLAKMKGTYNTMHHAVPIMKRQGFGRIINCSSAAFTGVSNLSAYSAANAAVVGLTKAVAMEVAPNNITANVYCPEAASPGHVVEFARVIRTLEERLGKEAIADPESMKKVEEDHGPAENAAPFLAYLCTEDASFISGSVFTVKGSGKIDLFSEPIITNRIWKKGESWTVEELKSAVPDQLLFQYESPAMKKAWQ